MKGNSKLHQKSRPPHIPLIGLSRSELRQWLSVNEQPSFRGDQIFRWIHQQGTRDPGSMTNLPKKLRNWLRAKTVVNPVQRQASANLGSGWVSYRWQSRDIEARVYNDWPVVYLQLQPVPEPVSAGETAAALVGSVIGELKEGNHLETEAGCDIVFLPGPLAGGWDPLAKLGTVFKAVDILHDELGQGIGYRRMGLLTHGHAGGIEQLAETGNPLLLAVRLYAPNDYIHRQVVPDVHQHSSLDEILSACEQYFKVTGQQIVFIYDLLAGVNDLPELARELGQLLTAREFAYRVQIAPDQAESDGTSRSFVSQLKSLGVHVESNQKGWLPARRT